MRLIASVLFAVVLAGCGGGGGGGGGPARLVILNQPDGEADLFWVALYPQAFEGDHWFDGGDYEPHGPAPLPSAAEVFDFATAPLAPGDEVMVEPTVPEGFYTVLFYFNNGIEITRTMWDVEIRRGTTIGVSEQF